MLRNSFKFKEFVTPKNSKRVLRKKAETTIAAILIATVILVAGAIVAQQFEGITGFAIGNLTEIEAQASISACGIGGIITSGGTYNLTGDLNNQADSVCITIGATANGAIFDCGGHTIDGTDANVGIQIGAANGVTIRNCIINDWSDGIQSISTTNLIIENCNITSNTNTGMTLTGIGKTIYNNFFNNTNNAVSSSTNNWNTTLTSRTNIIGTDYIGGNYWANPSGTGYSETCSVTQTAGLCDSTYTISGNNTDYHPITNKEITTIPEVTVTKTLLTQDAMVDDTVQFMINVTNNDIGITGWLIGEDFNTSYLNFTGSNPAPTFDDSTNGMLDWDLDLSEGQSYIIILNFTTIAIGNTTNYVFIEDETETEIDTDSAIVEIIEDTGPIEITDCQTISTTGEYELMDDITTTGTCLVIAATNISIDGAGHKMTGDGTGTGIDATAGYDELLIENFKGINNFSYGIHANGVDWLGAENNTINTSEATGGHAIYLQNTNNAHSINNTIYTKTGGVFGINIDNGDNTTIAESTIITNAAACHGIALASSSGCDIEANNITIKGSASYGIYLSTSATTNNRIWNNNISSIGDEINDATGDSAINYIWYNNTYGQINWTNTTNGGFLKDMDLQGSIGHETNLIIGNNLAYLNTPAFNSDPTINSSAEIIFYNMNYLGNDNYTILKNGENCTDCTKLTSSPAKFMVTSFSNYTTQGAAAQTTDIIIIKTATQTSFIHDLPFEFIINITNNGNTDLVDIMAYDDYNDSIMSFDASSCPGIDQGVNEEGGWIDINVTKCKGGNLAQGESYLIYVNFTDGGANLPSTAINYVDINATADYIDYADDADTATTTIRRPDLTITKTQIGNAEIGNNVQFETTIINNDYPQISFTNLSLFDTFDSTYLTYNTSNTTPNTITTNQLDYKFDLTDRYTITTTFTTQQTGITSNTVHIQEYETEGETTHATQNLSVEITDTGCTDNDGDGYNQTGTGCGIVDCDDEDNLTNPFAVEICGNSKDNDCDGEVDNKDVNNDGHIDIACTGTYVGGLPVDDINDDYILEICDGIDNDNSGTIDDKDIDGDNHIDQACVLYSGGLPVDDCNDNNNTIYLGAIETCNGIDDNCDSSIDNGLIASSNTNQVGVCEGSNQSCTGVTGWIDNYTSIPDYQVSETLCDDLDNDCDSAVDEPFPTKDDSCIFDNAGTPNFGFEQCTVTKDDVECKEGGYADNCPTPESEICDYLDNDCNNVLDDTWQSTLYDNCTVGIGECARDGYIHCDSLSTVACNATEGPAETEICNNSLDDDCDGLTDCSDNNCDANPLCGVAPNSTTFNSTEGSTDFSTVPNIENVTNLTLATTTGKIQFPTTTEINASGENYDLYIEIGDGFISVDTENLDTSFNTTANITINNVNCPATIYSAIGTHTTAEGILIAGTICNSTTEPRCTTISCTGGTLIFEVNHFTGYTGTGTTELTIWDETETDGSSYSGQTKNINEQIQFYANYTNTTDPIPTANCTINFTDGTFNMNYNETGFYDYNRSFTTTGTKNWNVTCNKTGYDTLTTIDTVEMTSTSTPNLINATTDKTTYTEGETITFTAYWNVSDNAVLIIADNSDFENCNYTEKIGCITNSSEETTSPITATTTANQSTKWYAKVCNSNGCSSREKTLTFTPNTIISTSNASWYGENGSDASGNFISLIEDVNGDGYDDILISAFENDDGGNEAGKVYLIFGKASGFENNINLSQSNASWYAEGAYDRLGIRSPISNGDINGDGYGDILIGADGNDYGGNSAGKTYLIFGKANGWSNNINISESNASWYGETNTYILGKVGSAGDFNGDGYDDILTSAYWTTASHHYGKTHLILGKASGWSNDININEADASWVGEGSNDYSGYAISSAGDVNNDGYDDILISAYGNTDWGSGTGKTYLILGNSEGLAKNVNLSEANASWYGDGPESSGGAVSSAGDVNNDGYDDILIGAAGNNYAGNIAGKIYLILGKESGWSNNINLSEADASWHGETTEDRLVGVKSTGDINGDGYDDILTSAMTNDYGGNNAGKIYLILGKTNGFENNINISQSHASWYGETIDDSLGSWISSDADINGDGYNDILISTSANDEFGVDAGKTYLILSTYEEPEQTAGIIITQEDITAPIITLNYPTGNSIDIQSLVTMNCSATDNIGLTNVSLYVNFDEWTLNETRTLNGITDSEEWTFNITQYWEQNVIEDTSYTWNCYACDTNGQCGWGTNETFGAWDLGTHNLTETTTRIGTTSVDASRELPENGTNDGLIDMGENVGLWHLDGNAIDSSGQGTNGEVNVDEITTKQAELTHRKKYFSCAEGTLNNKIYCFGGRADTSAYPRIIEEYDPATDTMTTKNAEIPGGRTEFSCAEDSSTGKIYCFGGINTSEGNTYIDEIFEYDPTTDTTIIKTATLPSPSFQHSCAENSETNKIYCIGGKNATTLHNYIIEYDPQTDTIIEKTATRTETQHSCTEDSSTHSIYCFGGSISGNAIIEYNSTEDTINVKTPMPLGGLFLSCEEDSKTNDIYCFGGNAGVNLYRIRRYNPRTDNLTIIDERMPLRVNAHSCQKDNSTRNIYCFGGSDSIYYNWTVEYNPENNVTGKISGGYKFDGVDDYILIGENISILNNVSGTTLMAWINLSSYKNFNLIITIGDSNSSSPTTSRADLFINESGNVWSNGRTRSYENPNYVSSINPINLNKWYHITTVIDYSQNNTKIYIDGIEQETTGTPAFTEITTNNSDSLFAAIGSEDTGVGNYFNGTMDELAVWNRSLTTEEINIIYERQRGQYAGRGTYESQIHDVGTEAVWKNLTWDPGNYYYQQELANNQEIEILTGGIDMTGNVLLLHMNDDSIISNETIIYDTSGLGNNATATRNYTYIDEFTSSETWTENDMTGTVLSGEYFGTITGNLPSIQKDIINFDEEYDTIEIRYKSDFPDGPNQITMYYTDNADCASFSETCKQYLGVINNDGSPHTLIMNITDAEWIDNDGTIDDLRFNFTGATPGGFVPYIYLDYIRFYKGNDPQQGIGILNEGIEFDGADDNLKLQDDSKINFTNGTVSLWFNLNSYSEVYQSLVAKDNPTNNDGDFYLFIEESDSGTNANKIRYTTSTTTTQYDIYSNSNAITNTWTHVSVTFGSEGMKMYINGILQHETNTTYTKGIENEDANFSIGYSRPDDPRAFNGTMDELAIWNRTLSAEEILNIYKRGTLNLNLTVRGCDDASCTGDEYLANCTDAIYCDISVLDATQYIQYKSEFETISDDYTPELLTQSVDIYYDLTQTDYANITNSTIINSTIDNSTIDNSTIDNSTIDDSYINNSLINDSNINNSNVTDSTVITSNVTNSTIDNSTITNSTIDDSFINNSYVDNSTINESTVIDSNVTDSTVENSTIDDSIVDDSYINNSIINESTIVDSNVTDSTVENSTIDSSIIDDSYINNSVVNESTVISSNVTDSTIENSTVTNSTIDDSYLNNSYVDNSTINESTVIDSNVTDSTVENSTIDDSIVDDSYINNSIINESTIVDSNVTDSTIINTNVTNSNITNSTIINSTIYNSTIGDSWVDNFTIDNCTIIGSNLTDGVCGDSMIDDSEGTGWFIDPSVVVGSTCYGNCYVTDSRIYYSTVYEIDFYQMDVNYSDVNYTNANYTILRDITLINSSYQEIEDNDSIQYTGFLYVDPSNLTNNTYYGDINITDSTVKDTIIEDSNISLSQVYNSTINLSIVITSYIDNCSLYNVTVIGRTCIDGVFADLGNLTCRVESGGCTQGYTDILHLSDTTNAHAELPNGTTYSYSICCNDTSGTYTVTNQTGTNFLDLSNPTNAHVELPNQPYYGYEAYLGVTGAAIACTYPLTSGLCPSEATCLATISDGTTNMHIADCVTTGRYITTVCCGITSNPIVQNIIINTDHPYLNNITGTDYTNLTGNFGYYDGDNDPNVYNETKWYKNNVEEPVLINLTYITSGNSTQGDNWTFSARVYDGTAWSAWMNSSTLIINTKPNSTAGVSSTNSLNTTDGDLTGSTGIIDIDNDIINQTEIRWYINDTLSGSHTNTTIVESIDTAIGDTWIFSTKVWDGSYWSNYTNATIIIQEDQAPKWSNNKTSIATGTAYDPTTSYQFNVTWTDDIEMDLAYIEHDFAGLNNYTMSNQSSEYYYNYATLAAGTYNWRSFGRDISGNWNITDQWTYIVNQQTTTVNLELNGTAADQSYNYPGATIATYWTNYLTATMYRNGTNVSTENNTIVNLGAGHYNYTVINTGNQNYTSSRTTYNIFIQQATPTCTLTITPSNPQTFPTTTNASCECTNTETSATLYRNNTDVTSSENNQNVNLAVGDYNYICNTTQTQNYTSASDTEIYSLTIATGNVELYLNGSAANFTTYNGSTVNITGILTTGTGNIQIYNNGNLTYNGTSPRYNTTTISDTGTYNITVIYTGNENYTEDREEYQITITQDTAPIVTLTSPADATTSTSTSQTFTCSMIDNIQLANSTLYTNRTGIWNSTTTTNISGTNNQTSFTISSLSLEKVMWNCYVCDTNGNCAYAPGNYTITIEAPAQQPTGGGGGGGAARPSICGEEWVCDEWSECLPNGTEIRNCWDLNKCDALYNQRIITNVKKSNPPIQAQSCEFTQTCFPETIMWGKEIIERKTGEPETKEYNIEITPGAYILYVGNNQDSSAEIKLNGEEIINEYEFNKYTPLIAKPIVLQEENTISVRPTGTPGSSLVLWVAEKCPCIGRQCVEGYKCQIGNCIPEPTCDDQIQNQGEEEIDCGAPCNPCEEITIPTLTPQIVKIVKSFAKETIAKKTTGLIGYIEMYITENYIPWSKAILQNTWGTINKGIRKITDNIKTLNTKIKTYMKETYTPYAKQTIKTTKDIIIANWQLMLSLILLIIVISGGIYTSKHYTEMDTYKKYQVFKKDFAEERRKTTIRKTRQKEAKEKQRQEKERLTNLEKARAVRSKQAAQERKRQEGIAVTREKSLTKARETRSANLAEERKIKQQKEQEKQARLEEARKEREQKLEEQKQERIRNAAEEKTRQETIAMHRATALAKARKVRLTNLAEERKIKEEKEQERQARLEEKRLQKEQTKLVRLKSLEKARKARTEKLEEKRQQKEELKQKEEELTKIREEKKIEEANKHAEMKKQYTEKLNKFVTEAITKGTQKPIIKNILLKQGWPKKFVNNYVDRYYKVNKETIKQIRKRKLSTMQEYYEGKLKENKEYVKEVNKKYEKKVPKKKIKTKETKIAEYKPEIQTSNKKLEKLKKMSEKLEKELRKTKRGKKK